MRKVLSISPWPSVWVMGEGGGSPSEGYAIQAMLKAGFGVTHLAPASAGLPSFEEQEHLRIVRIANPFNRLRPILRIGVGFFYKWPAVNAWSLLVSDWVRKCGQRFDLVVGHGLESALALHRAARYLGVPSVSRLYGISVPIDELKRGLFKERYFDLLFILRNPPDHIILTDDGTCGDQAMHIFGVSKERYDFLLNGYDPKLLSMPCEESSSPYVLTASRLVEEKRLDRVVRIAALCKKSMPWVKFIILGDGPMRPNLERLIRKLGLSQTVHLLGSLSRKEVHKMLARASVVLATQDVSNLNNTVLEALVIGKPVVALDTGCTQKLIRHGQTGLLYPPSELGKAAQGVARLIRDESYRSTLGRRAREFARKTLKPWPERVNQESSIYARFLKPSGASGEA